MVSGLGDAPGQAQRQGGSPAAGDEDDEDDDDAGPPARRVMRTSIQLLHPQPLLLYILDQLLELVHAN